MVKMGNLKRKKKFYPVYKFTSMYKIFQNYI